MTRRRLLIGEVMKTDARLRSLTDGILTHTQAVAGWLRHQPTTQNHRADNGAQRLQAQPGRIVCVVNRPSISRSESQPVRGNNSIRDVSCARSIRTNSSPEVRPATQIQVVSLTRHPFRLSHCLTKALCPNKAWPTPGVDQASSYFGSCMRSQVASQRERTS